MEVDGRGGSGWEWVGVWFSTILSMKASMKILLLKGKTEGLLLVPW